MKRGFLNKIYLLSWKNFILLRRQYIVTICEIVLPTLFTLALAYIRSKEEPALSYAGEYDSTNRETGFPEYDQQAMVRYLHNRLDRSYYYDNQSVIIGYAPKSRLGQEMLEKLVQEVNKSSSDTEWPPTRPLNVTVNVTGFDTEADMEAFHSSLWLNKYTGSWSSQPYFPFGVVFKGLSETAQSVSYTIRFSDSFYNTKDLMPINLFPGPDYYGAYQYVASSFSGVQLLLDKLLINKLTGKEPYYNISLQAFPYPEYKDFDLADFYNIFLPIFIVTGFVFVVPTVVRGVVSEKETGIKELMKMSGLPEWMHWFGWMLNSLSVLIITVTIVVVLLFVPFNTEVGAVFKHSDPTLMWVVLMVYAIWATTYCFMVSSFFERPTLATTAGIVIWLVSFYGLGLAMEEGYGKDFSLSLKLFLCLFPNVAINLALKAMCNFEAAEKGAKWGNMADSLNGADSLTLLYPFLMLIASIVVNMIICLYVEAVLPKKYGVRKPMYYIFQPSEWGFGRKSRQHVVHLEESANESTVRPGFEEEQRGIKVGVEIRNLKKEFGSKVAVNDMSVNIFEGQIFCLLGENGAGKTTTMSILTGLFSPTSGTAYINGYDIRTDMSKIRESIGLCPQHNMLFDKMTVLEHFKFFGMLKGLSSNKAEKEAIELMQLLQIEEKKNVLSLSLSGGQKRRVSLGCSIIGDSKAIFLDEPTSGMDPEARRALWNILLRIRDGRCIVLTTHFMEEADVLGDRIAIMASGMLQCCGSPNYLKKFYGAGYTLSMTVNNGAKHELILNAVRSHIPDAYFKVSHSTNDRELSVVLPSESNTSSSFPALFAELRNRQNELGIDEIGMGYTTMDEVFVRVEELSHNTEQDDGDEDLSNISSTKNEKAEGLSLIFSQFYGLLMKKLLLTVKRKRLIFSQMLIPILLTIASVAITRAINTSNTLTPPLKMEMSGYNKPITLYSSLSKSVGDVYAATVGSSAKLLDSKFDYNVSEGLLDVGRNDVSYYKERFIIAAEINEPHMKAMHSSLAPHSAPLSMNILTNTLLRMAAPNQGTLKIETINHPFPNNMYDLFKSLEDNPASALYISFIFGVLVPIGMALLVGTFLIVPTEERLNKGKQLQLMTGVNPLLYWGSMYICDYFLMLVTICLMTACLPIFENHKTFTNHGGAGVFFLIMAVYGVAVLSFSYICSTFVRTVAGGFTLITIIHLVTGIGFGIGSFILDTEIPNNGATTVLNVLGRLFPTFGVTKATIHYAQISSSNSVCNTLSDQAVNILCNPSYNSSSLSYESTITQECCKNCKVLGNGECFEPTPYFQWTKEVTRTEYSYDPEYGYYTSKDVVYILPGFTQDLVWLGLIAVVYLIVLIMIEYDLFKMILEKITKENATSFRQTVSDADVLDESSRLNNLVSESRTAEDAMVVHNLCKSFGGLSAVSSLSFGVHPGECFGLLGVNGAGKTTTFRMLTGDENRSSGNAYMDNLSLVQGRKQFLSKLGYCPQFDGIVGVLTGREMLSLFARLRGIPGHLIHQDTEKWLKRTGLLESGNVACEKYSGGMKRRLSAAIALIGDPPVILLDEPTSGVDPVARRKFWKTISSIKNSGQAIILTSHSMEECEALCSRLGIMVNGEMQCLGGVQHLKNKFAQGYSLTIKLRQEHYQNKEVVDKISNDVFQIFNPCSLKDHHQTTMKFQIHSQSRRWEDLYRDMEEIKKNNQEGIEEYAITETTLEEVFLSFARMQYSSERVTTGSCFRRMLC